MKMTRREAICLYKKREYVLDGICGAIHPYELSYDESVIEILSADDCTMATCICEDENKDIYLKLGEKLAKELSIRHYMLHGESRMRDHVFSGKGNK